MNQVAEQSKVLSAKEKSDIAKFEKAQTRWWIYTPAQLREIEANANRAYAKLEKEINK